MLELERSTILLISWEFMWNQVSHIISTMVVIFTTFIKTNLLILTLT
jgi:hypothetical protein